VSSRHPSLKCLRRSVAAGLVGLTVLLAEGCSLNDSISAPRAPAVSSRFTSNPLSDKPKRSNTVLTGSAVPMLKLGLALQSGIDPVHSQFAARLGTVLVRELQLSGGSLAVEPMTTLTVNQVHAVQPPVLHERSPTDVITVAFSDAQDTLPSQLPPNPMLMVPTPPVVDQILVVRVIEYRPYFPLLTTLEIRVLDGDSHEPIFATTGTWSGVDYRLVESEPKRSLRQSLFCNEPRCEPSPGHNSPQALMHEISRDISEWYNQSLSSSLKRKNHGKPSFRERMSSPFRKDDCRECEASLSSMPASSITASDVPQE